MSNVVQQQLEKARSAAANKPWMALAGKAHGPRDLSTREGFGKRGVRVYRRNKREAIPILAPPEKCTSPRRRTATTK